MVHGNRVSERMIYPAGKLIKTWTDSVDNHSIHINSPRIIIAISTRRDSAGILIHTAVAAVDVTIRVHIIRIADAADADVEVRRVLQKNIGSRFLCYP